MGECVIIYGKSGTGKSRSLLNFGEDEILQIKTIDKRNPFRKKFKMEYKTSNIESMKNALSKMPCKTAVIDDFGYQQTAKFMAEHSLPKSGGSSFDMYNRIADDVWNLITFIKNQLPEDKIVYLIFHEEGNDYGDVKIKTIGKLLDQKVCIEGMVTVCLRAMKEGTDKYFFRTQSDGMDISKSPEGLFESDKIPNDLAAVDKAIREYWGL